MSIVMERPVGAQGALRPGGVRSDEGRQQAAAELEAARKQAQAALEASQEAARKLAETVQQAGGAR
ncbi:hypothetical protein ACFU3J_16290 [Streptomyces sp. NPDC057411]|uniref:hypothetical protein n=1 Tax=unclassified Streptomyces TaxID=2593676 RepID=UPI00363C5E7A